MWESKFYAGHGKMGLTRALRHFSRLEASDPRDKVFGTLGTLSDLPPVPDLLRPEYTKSVAAVFRDATRHAIQHSQGLYILRYISHREEDDIGRGGFPSWVPRFDRAPEVAEDPYPLEIEDRLYFGRGTGGYDQLGEYNANANVLVLRGVVIDEIKHVYPVFGEEDIGILWETLRLSLNARPEFNVKFARTLTADTNHRLESPQKEDFQVLNAWIDYKSNEQLGSLDDLPPDADKTLKQATLFNEAMVNATNKRRFAFSKSGLTALVPKISKPGDMFVSIDGALVPYVLRSVGVNYQILGQCYLENNMDGQALKDYEQREDDYTIFNVV